jgi:formylmethanofuran dehydrogenase subunit B
MPNPSSPQPTGEVRDVACPFCGLVCDDLVVDASGARLQVTANGCPLAVAEFGRKPGPAKGAVRVGGKAAPFEEAVAAAARLLGTSKQPLIAGLGTDLAGTRAASRLAERAGAALDHMNSAAFVRNLLVLQDSGWITTTLSEVRNHADLIIVAGTDIETRMPRFFERCVANRETLFGNARQCEVVYVGSGPTGQPPVTSTSIIKVDPTRLHEGFALLRALIAGRPIGAASAAGVPLATWKALAKRCRDARYGVIAWMAADLDFPQADMTVQVIGELVRDLNRHTRFAGLPLGGTDGDVTADAVILWQTGFGLRTSLAGGQPDHDSYHYSAERMLAREEADFLLWISSFSTGRTPTAADIPTVVLGRDGMTLEREPDVFITVGTPGVDHAGHLFRTDRVVALPLHPLRQSRHPSVAEVLAAIEAALGEAASC